MNRPESPIPDVQSHPDERSLAIDRVGIRGLRYPIRFADGAAPAQPTIATFSLSVALPAEQKGTHMSRLVAVIDELAEPLTLGRLPALIDALLTRLDATRGGIAIEFPWFRRKAAPVSGVESMMDYEVRLMAEAVDGARKISVTLVVPVMSLCPSSKAIADYGAHNQRSHLTLAVRPRDPASITLLELIALAEEEASCELYALLKRADEKYVTERAYDRPRFVEDLVRGIAARLAGDPRFEGFRVEAENFESIHNHSAYACIERGA
ncbi:MAG TPA: GTP cyclohydrolase FolE2 [Casimicrobiaceae bacterium]|nr:GTP cyclohydrolase FolE2 [Casimicrobiaceae bacterium]